MKIEKEKIHQALDIISAEWEIPATELTINTVFSLQTNGLYYKTPIYHHFLYRLCKTKKTKLLNKKYPRILHQDGQYNIYIRNAVDFKKFMDVKFALYENYIITPPGGLYKLNRAQTSWYDKLRYIDDTRKIILNNDILETVKNNTVEFLQRAKHIRNVYPDVHLHNGILLYGPPGNGKSFVCQYIQNLCGKLDFDFEMLTSRQFIKSVVDDGNLPEDVWVVDDIDINILNRDSSGVATDILSRMNNSNNSKHPYVLIFTTNQDINEIEEAFKRPGRINVSIKMEKPTDDLRQKYFEEMLNELTEFDIQELVEETEDMSFAELNNIYSILVFNKEFGDNTFNVDNALEQFYKNRQDLKPKKKRIAGFQDAK